VPDVGLGLGKLGQQCRHAVARFPRLASQAVVPVGLDLLIERAGVGPALT